MGNGISFPLRKNQNIRKVITVLLVVLLSDGCIRESKGLKTIGKRRAGNNYFEQYVSLRKEVRSSNSLIRFGLATAFVQITEKRQGVKISALEEIAFRKDWINNDELLNSAIWKISLRRALVKCGNWFHEVLVNYG